jgi:hypothetical protein
VKVTKTISESRNKKQMEVIGKDDDGQRTLHIRKQHNEWRYFAGCDKKGNKVFLPITV